MPLVWGAPSQDFDPGKGYRLTATKYIDPETQAESVSMTFDVSVYSDGFQASEQDWLDMLTPTYEALIAAGWTVQLTHTGAIEQVAATA